MNKQEKEVILGQLDSEKAVLRELQKQYERALRDINNRIKILQADDTPSRAYQADYQKTLKAQIEAILEKLHADEYDTIHKYMTDSYTDGFIGTMYTMGKRSGGIHVITPLDQKAAVKAIVTDSKLSVDLYGALGYDMDKLKKHVREEITRGIATSLPYEQIAQNISGYTSMPLANAYRIVRTEGHRIQQASADDARNAAKAKGADVLKQWDASLDGATRPLHRQLDGQIRETDEPFEAGGKKVMYPGKFGDPSQDCNCRCVALTRARWALNEKELETLKERAGFFGLDKEKDFDAYKNTYLKVSKLKEKDVQKIKGISSETRRVYGKGDGQYYSAQFSSTVTQQYSYFDNGKKVEKTYEKTFNVPENTETTKLMVYELPKLGGFIGGKYATDETKNVILPSGRIAMNYSHFNSAYTRNAIASAVQNEIDILGGIRKEGVFYRVTSNPKDASYIKAGKIRLSKNHATGEKEDGLSVWETVKYADKYIERITGDVIGVGSDGEPLLDVKTVKLIDVNEVDIAEMRKKGKESFMEIYGWTEDQVNQALNGGFKKIRR